MRLHALLVGLAVIVGVAVAVYFESGRLQAPGTPESAIGTTLLEDAVREIEAGTQASPLIGEQPRRGQPTVTFLAKAEGTDVPRIVSDVTGWGERADGSFDYNVGRMTRVGQTRWYSLETKVEPYARIDYLIAYGGSDYRLDPHNPRKVQRVGGPASEVVLPGYIPPQEFVDPPVQPAGIITETVLASRAIGDSRRVIVYTPPGYETGGRYPLAVFHDGALVVNSGEAPRVLDWLISHNAIEPIVAVFVDPKSRTDDLRRGAPMRAFVAGELLSWVAAHYSVTADAAARAIIGVSAGARAALDTASALDAFDRIGLLIPALEEAGIEDIPRRGGRHLRVSIVAAHYDSLNLGSARAAQITLSDRGHKVDFVEVPEGHSTATWRTHLRTVLISLFGK